MRGDSHVDQDLHGIPVPLNARCRELANHRFFIHGREHHLMIDSATTGCGDLEAKTKRVDRFKLRWQNGSRGSTCWWVILNASKPIFPPDFIFNDGFLPPMEKLPSLERWNPERENALVEILEELIAELAVHELHQISPAQRAEYERLLDKPYVIRRFCSASVSPGESVDFWIRLEFDKDPVLYADVHYKQILSIQRQHLIELAMSDNLRKTLGTFECGNSGSSLSSTIELIYQDIISGLDAEKRSMNDRRELLGAILTLQGDSLLEIDMALFRRVGLLLKSEEAYVEVRIELPARFRQGDDIINLYAEDTYNRNCIRRHRYEIARDVADPMQIAQQIMEHTERMTEEIARQIMDRL